MDLLQENDLLKKIIAVMPGNVYWIDSNNVYQGCNNNMAILAGLSSPTEIIGLKNQDLPWNVNDPDLAKALDEVNAIVMRNGIIQTIEEPATLSNGEKKVYLSNKVPLREGDKVIGMVGISTDITERKKLEEDLVIAKEKAEAGERAKTEFIANISHDVRTPITGILGFSEYLEENLREGDSKEIAGDIYQGGKQLLGLLNAVLDLSVGGITEKKGAPQVRLISMN